MNVSLRPHETTCFNLCYSFSNILWERVRKSFTEHLGRIIRTVSNPLIPTFSAVIWNCPIVRALKSRLKPRDHRIHGGYRAIKESLGESDEPVELIWFVQGRSLSPMSYEIPLLSEFEPSRDDRRTG